jgi:Tol biopolymer transport system component
MSLAAGERLGPYEIIEQIGKGGMGVVYRAHDPRLGRDIAIKVSMAAFTERFERETRVIASLNHPNIATLHDVGPNYLVMELVEGETLAERIRQGRLPMAEVLRIAHQVADALEAAHEKGITHRDLKPGNIKIKPDGSIKVLDFGLAKTGGMSAVSNDDSPTLAPAQTQAGMILGTAAYMSPEQAKGKVTDKRADIWAFGVVLYEMLSGRPLFDGETTTEILAAVIEREPQWNRVPNETQTLLRRCLEKDPRRRLRDIADAMPLLEERPTPAAPRRPLPWVAAAVVLFVALAVVSFLHFRESPPDLQQARLIIPIPEKFVFGSGTAATVSPDGRFIAFPAQGADGIPHMWLRRIDSLDVKALEGTEPVSAGNAPPFWSFDSRFVAYAAGGKLRMNAVSGGPAQAICDVTGGAPGGTWNRNNVIVYGSNSGALMRVAAIPGGKPSPITILAPGDSAHRWPQFLPDQRHFIYHRASSKVDAMGVYVGSLDAKPEDQSLKPLLISDRQAEFVPSMTNNGGWLLFLREGTLLAQAFNPESLQLSGDPVPIAAGVGSFPVPSYGMFSASETGMLVYRSGAGGQMQLNGFDSQGNSVGAIGEPGQYAFPAMSPDNASRIAVSKTDAQGNQDIWILSVAHGNSSRLTYDPSRDTSPVWFPKGDRIVFSSFRNGHADLYTHAADGSGQDELLYRSDEDKTPFGFSPDGKYLLFTSNNPRTQSDIWVLPMEGDSKPHVLLSTPFVETTPQVSPDGRWFAYTSNESSGQPQIFVRPFSGISEGESNGGRKMVSQAAGGVAPRWRGRQLLYLTLVGDVMAVDVNTDKAFEFENPKRLFMSPAPPSFLLGYGDISADAKRFLFVVPQGASNAPSPFTVILNWQTSLKK